MRWVHAVDQRPTETRGHVLHLIRAHAVAGEFLHAEAKARRRKRASVAWKHVHVRDDTGLFEEGCCGPSSTRVGFAVPSQHLMAGGVPAFFGQHVEAFGCQSFRQRLGVRDGVLGITGTVGLKLGQRHRFACHMVKVVGGVRSGEDGVVETALCFLVVGVRKKEPSLWPWEGFVRRSGHQVRSFTKRVLKHTTGDEAEHVGSIVHDTRPDLVSGVGEFLQRRWEQKHGRAKQRKGWFGLSDHGSSSVHVRLHAVFVPRIGVEVQPSQSNGAHLSVRNVASVRR